MNSQIIIGMCLGAMVVGASVFCYALIREIRSLTRLTAVLVPLLQNEGIINGLQSFRLLVLMGEDMGKKIASLDETIKVFSEFAMTRPLGAPEAPKPPEESGVYPYNEEAAASRVAATSKAKPAADSEGAVFIPPQDPENSPF